MEEYSKTVALVLVALVLWILLDRQQRDISALLSLAVCCLAAAGAMAYIKPVLSLLHSLEQLGRIQGGLLKPLLKAVGIGFLTETVGTLCADAGNSAMGNTVRFFGSAVILYVSLPVFQALVQAVQEIMGIL